MEIIKLGYRSFRMNQESKVSIFSSSIFQWISLMITVIGMNSAALVYISSIKERVSVLEERQSNVIKVQDRTQMQLDALQKLVTDGMTLRVVLQADAITMKKQLDRIEDLIISHINNEIKENNKGIK
jgi:hypothetical protein